MKNEETLKKVARLIAGIGFTVKDVKENLSSGAPRTWKITNQDIKEEAVNSIEKSVEVLRGLGASEEEIIRILVNEADPRPLTPLKERAAEVHPSYTAPEPCIPLRERKFKNVEEMAQAIADADSINKAAKGQRHNAGKPQLSLIREAPHALVGMARGMEYGLKKYSRGNWKQGLHWVGILDCLDRHMTAFLNGQDIDPESGIPHVDLMQCNTLMLAEMFHTRPDLDDRTTVATYPLPDMSGRQGEDDE